MLWSRVENVGDEDTDGKTLATYLMRWHAIDAEHILVEGTVDGATFTLTAHRNDPSKKRLMSRGFHWVHDSRTSTKPSALSSGKVWLHFAPHASSLQGCSQNSRSKIAPETC